MSFWIQKAYSCTVIEAESIEKAREILTNRDPLIDLIIYDFQKDPIKNFRRLRSSSGVIPCIVCLSGISTEMKAEEKSFIRLIDRAKLTEEIQNTMKDFLSKGAIPGESADEREYFAIRTRILLSVCPLKGDIYIRLSAQKFVKLFREGDDFNEADLVKYTLKKGVNYLFIKRNQTDEFISKYLADLQALTSKENLSTEEVSRSAESVHETVQELGKRLGFNEGVQQLARTQIAMTMKAMGKSPALGDVLKKLEQSRGEYVASHSLMTGFLACAIASYMDWKSEATFFKLNLAAFLHDITLDNQKLAACETIQDLSKEPFKEEEMEAFRNHPQNAADIARRFSEVPPDVDTIIAQHHERPDGTGFPRRLSGNYIAPLASIFIVAHDLARYSRLRPNEKIDVKEFIKQGALKYKSSQFKKVLAVLEANMSDMGMPEPGQPAA